MIFLSAADDLLRGQPNVGKSSVLLANIIPCFVVKLIAPHYVRIIPYGYLVSTCILLSLVSLLTVALFKSIAVSFFGIVLASASSGLGETAFLALTSYHHPQTVIAWSSGTGAAGIVGAFYYLVLATWFGLSMKTTLLIASLFPCAMGVAYLLLLSPEHTNICIEVEESEDNSIPKTTSSLSRNDSLFSAMLPLLKNRFLILKPLMLRYVAPLFLVYYCEYVINNSVYFSLLFPLEKTPFTQYRQHYPTYSALYQTGVFLSRTLARTLPITNEWTFAGMQAVMLVFLSIETAYGIVANVYVIFALILVEGLLGGAAYVNTFCNISEKVPKEHVEFSMAFTTVADSTGISLAGLTCLLYEPFLCARNSLCMANRVPP